jgi:H+/gluconate symporter-like permease
MPTSAVHQDDSAAGTASLHRAALPGLHAPVTTDQACSAIWAVQAALLLGILLVVVTAFGRIRSTRLPAARRCGGGALLAAMNTASEYGFGGVIASLPGFSSSATALKEHPESAGQRSGVRQLAGRHHRFGLGRHEHRAGGDVRPVHQGAQAANIPLEVLHRVAAMASGGMDTLPHNGAVITLLAVTGLTHRESYKEIFCITLIKTLAVFLVIGTFYATGIV